MRLIKAFLFLLFITIAFSTTINILVPSGGSLVSEEVYEGYIFAVKDIQNHDSTVNFNIINLTSNSTNATALSVLLNSNPTIIPNKNFFALDKSYIDFPVVVTYHTLKYINPYPIPKDEIKALEQILNNSKKLLFIYNSDLYAYNYLKSLESIEDKIIFMKKYSASNGNLSQTIEKNSIDTIITFLTPLQLKNLIQLIRVSHFSQKDIKIIALSVYDYFDYIKEYTKDYDGLLFFTILNVSSGSSFFSNYLDYFGHPPTAKSAAAYDSVEIMYSYLKNSNVVYASSKIETFWDKKRVIRPLYLYKVENGSPVLQAILKY